MVLLGKLATVKLMIFIGEVSCLYHNHETSHQFIFTIILPFDVVYSEVLTVSLNKP